jgi:hypothetical protein
MGLFRADGGRWSGAFWRGVSAVIVGGLLTE